MYVKLHETWHILVTLHVLSTTNATHQHVRIMSRRLGAFEAGIRVGLENELILELHLEGVNYDKAKAPSTRLN